VESYTGMKGRIDERDTMFCRKRLNPGDGRYESYYQLPPENQAIDDEIRKYPGLLDEGASLFESGSFAATEAPFSAVEALQGLVDAGSTDAPAQRLDPESLAQFIQNWALHLGAHSCGFTDVRDYHLYSHVGRGPDYGQAVDLDHSHAVALSVEMDRNMMASAPYGPTVMESARQYLRSGMIAVQIAAFLRNQGYQARAHIDANYRVVCPLVARDAGLGEIGRMGLLMTPRLGPRVRLAVVTTDAALPPTGSSTSPAVIDFCERCKKCADACPAKAISFDHRTGINGVKRWQINQEDCYSYWCQTGTDCGRCVVVCPYSHPDNAAHNLVRWGIERSTRFAGLALKLDNFFYGRKPAPKMPPGWIDLPGRH